MYPPVAATTRPREKLSDEVSFSCVGSRVIDVDQSTFPVPIASLTIRPSGAPA